LMSACISGASTLAGVTTETPVSMSFGTLLPCRWSTSVVTASADMRNGFCRTKPWSSPLCIASTKPGWRRSRPA
jgi:hypothetical protein